MSNEHITPTHPGKILLRGLKDLKFTLSQTARGTGIPLSTLSAIVNGRRSISAENAMRIGRYLNTSAKYWVNLQADYDLRVALYTKSECVEKEVVPAI
jgi:addiction module HigA family antidote